MANASQRICSSRKHHYTVQQLLQLSKPVPSSFDLSKFSYDAARAGMVPGLGNHAMKTRRTSSDRREAESDETASAGDDVTLYSGNSLAALSRDPVLLPASPRAREDRGFARFLRKHSSPTHQRVTAGGRIVPMEARPSPPPFVLSTTSNNRKVTAMDIQQNRLVSKVDGDPRQLLTPNVSDLNLVKRRTDPASTDAATMTSTSFNSMTSELADIHARSRRIMPVDHTLYPDDFFEPPRPAMTTSAVHTEPRVGTSIPYTDGCSTSVDGLNAFVGVIPPQPYDRSCTGPQHLPWLSNRATIADLIDRQLAGAQKSLLYWTQCYEELDRQLKSLDRQRAMSTLNSEMVKQRREVVQQRSDTKDMISKIRCFLGMSEHASAISQQVALNVNAPAYVPTAQVCGTNKDPPTRLAAHVGEFNRSLKICLPGGRRPIPIITPAATSQSPSGASDRTIAKTMAQHGEQEAIDAGDMQQKVSSEQDQAGITADVRERHWPLSTSSICAQDVRVKCFSENDAYLMSNDYDQSSEDSEASWVQTNADKPPSETESQHECNQAATQQDTVSMCVATAHAVVNAMVEEGDPACQEERVKLDSDQGVCTAANTMTEVQTSQLPRGANIPHSTTSDAHGEDRASKASPLSIAPIDSSTAEYENSDNGKENHIFVPVVSTYGDRKAATEPYGSQPVAQHAHNLVSLTRANARSLQNIHAVHAAIAQTNKQDTYGLITESTSMKKSQSGSGLRVGTTSAVYKATLPFWRVDAPSSVCVQNIHAAAQLPHLDGANDSHRVTRSLLDAMTGPVSPELSARHHNPGSAWFAPFRRGAIPSVGHSKTATACLSRKEH